MAEQYSYKHLTDANFICDEAPITATMVKAQFKDSLCSILHPIMKIFSRQEKFLIGYYTFLHM